MLCLIELAQGGGVLHFQLQSLIIVFNILDGRCELAALDGQDILIDVFDHGDELLYLIAISADLLFVLSHYLIQAQLVL